MWYVYVLLCQDQSLYTGISTDPEKRFIHHKKGKGARYTRSHKPIKIIYQEKIGTRSDALKQEGLIKSWSREEKIANLKLTLPGHK